MRKVEALASALRASPHALIVDHRLRQYRRTSPALLSEDRPLLGGGVRYESSASGGDAGALPGAGYLPLLRQPWPGRHFDAAVICTPAHLHLPMALTLLAARKHLLVEKPLALDTELLPATREAIAQAKVFVGVAYVYHFMPWVAGARQFLQTGSLGRVLQASVVCGQRFHLSPGLSRDLLRAARAWRRRDPGCAGRAWPMPSNGWSVPARRLYCDAAHQMLEGVSVEDTVDVCAHLGTCWPASRSISFKRQRADLRHPW